VAVGFGLQFAKLYILTYRIFNSVGSLYLGTGMLTVKFEAIRYREAVAYRGFRLDGTGFEYLVAENVPPLISAHVVAWVRRLICYTGHAGLPLTYTALLWP